MAPADNGTCDECLAPPGSHLVTCSRYTSPTRSKPGSGDTKGAKVEPSTSVVTEPDGRCLFISGVQDVRAEDQGNQDQQDQDAEALRLARDPAAWIDKYILVDDLVARAGRGVGRITLGTVPARSCGR